MFEILTQNSQVPRIAVFGVGGCGCNTINQLIQVPFGDNVHFVAVNTDAQALAASQCSTRLQIGLETTKGLGAGAKPQQGHDAAQESEAELRELIELADIIFITGGMGGGTGTGAIPFMASVAKDLNKPLVAVVSSPFGFEGYQRNQLAKTGVEQLMQYADAVIVLPNDQLSKALDKKVSLVNAFFESNRILQDVLLGLTTTISQSGLINIDLNDFIAVVSHQGRAAMGVAKQVAGEDLLLTINKALKNPLLEDVDLTQAKGAIVSVIATESIELSQYNKIGETLHQQLDPGALVILGLTIVPQLDCELELMVIATGIQAPTEGLLTQDKVVISQSKNDRFRSAELINVHDFLEKQASSKHEQPFSTELDIPTYTRQRRPN
ncbi:cell division protein FtsZ [Shewanella mesophila]|uniref:cell division protein FtsZ n=1 Tax=Shewanella mesophila TaxID=2864208 RepID=UPI001C65C764|nr:cell division protein FtsZ [Shewanella mesophila]QYJ87202.1 cell division protein FtsZ [Shewanella mesophila]